MLDLAQDPIALTAALVDVASVSGDEAPLADLVEAALRALPHLDVVRDGNNVVARTSLGRERRVLLAGHLDTVPVADNLPSRRDGNRLYGCGTSDMKAGDAVLLHLAATLPDPAYDLTFVLYDNEEVEADKNGLKRLVETRRDLLDADGRSFRFVISAVLALRRELFTDLGGFDERYVGYGGEDWDLAHRAWNAGAVLVHERDAVAVHDGPDWALREGEAGVRQRAAKDAETARLAALVPEPLTRGAPLPGQLPDVLVDVAAYEPRCVHALLRQDHRDLQVRVSGAGELHAGAVRDAPWTPDQQARARVRLSLDIPVPLGPAVVGDLVRTLTRDGLGELELQVDGRRVGVAQSTRALGRARRWAGREPDVVGRCFGRRTVEVAVGAPRDDLAGFLAADWG